MYDKHAVWPTVITIGDTTTSLTASTDTERALSNCSLWKNCFIMWKMHLPLPIASRSEKMQYSLTA